jgi:FKBP-type peptidyl-prolyl cis-trans isomerase SlyD
MIKNGTVVDLAYTLTNSKGKVLDRADANEPLTYLQGTQQIIPGLENALEGLSKGAKKKVTIAPAEAYGEVDPALRMTLKRSQFPGDAELEQGMQFQTRGNGGQEMVFTVESIQGDTVTVDGNHPLAGQTLHFDVEVLSVRDATEEEKAHGHAHGPDGHHHH